MIAAGAKLDRLTISDCRRFTPEKIEEVRGAVGTLRVRHCHKCASGIFVSATEFV